MTQITSPYPNLRSRCLGTLGRLLLLAAIATRIAAAASDDPHLRQSYARSYDALKGVAPNMLVMELRDRVELIASRGSQVGAASNAPRVRGFESALLQGLQSTLCASGSSDAARPSPLVMEKIGTAAGTQQMRMQPDDVAELTALAQRLMESQRRERWCSLKSLDEIR